MNRSNLRTLVRRTPLTVLAGLAGLIAQGYYAGHRTLPHFLDQDGSGLFGTPEGEPITIVALGDSTLTGPGLLGMEDLWIRQAIDRLPDGYCIDLRILARGGAWTRDLRDEHLATALALRPDIAILASGSNDSVRGVPLRSIRADLTYMAGALAAVADTVVLMGVGDMGTIPRMPQPLSTVLKWRSRAADRQHARVARSNPQIIHLAIWDEASQPFRDNPGLFGSDLFHPNADGHAIWADVAYPVLAAACKRVVDGRNA